MHNVLPREKFFLILFSIMRYWGKCWHYCKSIRCKLGKKTLTSHFN